MTTAELIAHAQRTGNKRLMELAHAPVDGPVTYILPFAAIGKPRMTRRDKWKRRPCVMRYRAWADRVREICRNVPPAEATMMITTTATYKAKRRNDAGKLKRTKPDPDNIKKAVMDVLWPGGDQAVGDIVVRRRWGHMDQTIIEIETEYGVPLAAKIG